MLGIVVPVEERQLADISQRKEAILWQNKIIELTEAEPEDLLANPLNARRHPPEQRNALRASLDELGWIAPVIVNKRTGYMVDGHARCEEAITKNISKIPVIYVDLTEQEEKNALAIFDPISNLATYDQEILNLLAEETVYENKELENLLDSLREQDNRVMPEDIDDIPEPPKTPISKLGDIWLLDGHRVMCGDSTDKATVATLMDGKKADMVFTDPPYNTGIQQGRTSKEWGIIKNDAMTETDFAKFCKAFVDVLYKYSEGDKYICMSWATYDLLYQAMPNVKNCIVWVKNNFGLGHGYRPQHEFILFDGGNIKANDESNVWFEKKDGATEYKHPTQKPVALAARAISNSSRSGQAILDLFLGSGSTLIACEQTDRTCYGLELDPQYVDVICKRWQTLTGTLPVLEATGETHDFS